MAASSKSVSVDPEVMNSVVWRSFPQEVLSLVLARLPVRDITRLRCLSRAWNRELSTANSDINRACAEASPTRVALLSQYSEADRGFCVSIYDCRNHSWEYAYAFILRNPGNRYVPGQQIWTMMDACDGLVCFLSVWKPTKRKPLCITVMNLLTRVRHELPPLHQQYRELPTMVRIKVDAETKCYKLVVVGKQNGGPTVETYDSRAREWSGLVPGSGHMTGLLYEWSHTKILSSPARTKCKGEYNYAEGKLETYRQNRGIGEDFQITVVHAEDAKFWLHKPTQMDASEAGTLKGGSLITEYHYQRQSKDWVEVKSYECPEFGDLEGVDMLRPPYEALHACDGFLMVRVAFGIREKCWLLDVSTSEWTNLPTNPWPSASWKWSYNTLMCRAFWNVVP